MPHIYFDNLQTEEPSPYDNDHDYKKIHTPYSAFHFQIFLECAQLISRYPELPFKLTNGFPIGNFTSLNQTFAPPNLPGASLHVDTICAYIVEELHLGRFSGPFTREELERKIGPFRSSPLQIATKEGAPGKPTKYHVCQHLSYKGKAQFSINDKINSDEYPMHWGKATDIAKIVHCSDTSFSSLASHMIPYILLDILSHYFITCSHLPIIVSLCASLISSTSQFSIGDLLIM